MLCIINLTAGHSCCEYRTIQGTKTAGANAFLNKPFTLSQLRTTVQQLLADPLSVLGA